MPDQDDPIRLIYTTFASLEDAESAGRALVARRLAGCVNILPGMVAVYEWNGGLARESEVVMIVKTRLGMLDGALAALEELHPYETPALITIAPERVSGPYADWLRRQTEPT